MIKIYIASLLIILPALIFSSRSESVAEAYTTNFPSTENPISENAKWVSGKTNGVNWSDVRTTPGLAFGTQTGVWTSYNDSIAVLTGTWGNDHQAYGTVRSVNQNSVISEEIELLMRFSITANSARGYECAFSSRTTSSYVQVTRWNGPLNDFTALGGGIHAIANGDTITCTISGTNPVVITTYVNGTQVFQALDSSVGRISSGGSPGLGHYNRGGTVGNNADYGLTSFTASD
jgi:hypothetical protein